MPSRRRQRWRSTRMAPSTMITLKTTSPPSMSLSRVSMTVGEAVAAQEEELQVVQEYAVQQEEISPLMEVELEMVSTLKMQTLSSNMSELEGQLCRPLSMSGLT